MSGVPAWQHDDRLIRLSYRNDGKRLIHHTRDSILNFWIFKGIYLLQSS